MSRGDAKAADLGYDGGIAAPNEDVAVIKVEELETAVSQLTQEELARFRTWFAEFVAAKWDEQFEHDVGAGRLDDLADRALEQHRRGTTTEL